MSTTDQPKTDREPFAMWAILELMGHRRLAGFVQEVEVFGKGMVRIDVPAAIPVTQWYNPDAIYSLTPTNEELARRLAQRVDTQLVSRYELPPAKAERLVCSDCGLPFYSEDTCVVTAEGTLRCGNCQMRLDAGAEDEDIEHEH